MEEENIKNEEEVAQPGEGPAVVEMAMTPKKKAPMGTYLVIGLAVIVVLGFVLISVSGPKDVDDTVVPALVGEYPDVVAIVNGEEVSSALLTKSVTQSEQIAQQNGLDITDAAVRAQIDSQALEILLNTTLLSQAATAAGIFASEEQITEQITVLEAQFGGPEGLQAQLDSLAISEEDLRVDLATQISIQTYLEGAEEFQGLTVTQEEIEEAYGVYLLENPELPPLEEIASQIEELLLGQKQQDASNLLIERLRTEAVIETRV